MQTYTKREMAHLLGVSPRTIADDAKFLNLQPTLSDRQTKRYSKFDFNLISQLREHCADKSNTRESFMPNTAVEIVEEEPKVTPLTSAVKTNSNITKYEESLNFARASDPLFDLEMLQRISDRNWLMPSARLAPLLGISIPYLNSMEHYNYCGFIISKKAYANNKILWKITPPDLIRVGSIYGNT